LTITNKNGNNKSRGLPKVGFTVTWLRHQQFKGEQDMPKRYGKKQHTKAEALERAQALVAYSNQVAGVNGAPQMFEGFIIGEPVMEVVNKGKALYTRGDFHNSYNEFVGAMSLLAANASWYFVHFVERFEQKLDDTNSRFCTEYEDLRHRGSKVLVELKRLASEAEHQVRAGKQRELDFSVLSRAHWDAKEALEAIKAEAQQRIENANKAALEAERLENERLATERRNEELAREAKLAEAREAEIENLFADSALTPATA
jgi:hypothetical protein